MPSIHKEISLAASPDAAWDVVRDVGAVHTRFAKNSEHRDRVRSRDERAENEGGVPRPPGGEMHPGRGSEAGDRETADC